MVDSVMIAILLTFLNVLSTYQLLQQPQEHQNCICVPYWQCKDDFSGLVEDGIDIIDVRISENAEISTTPLCVGDFDVCCPIKCGQRKFGLDDIEYDDLSSAPTNRMSPRILGDNDAEFAEFPWMLALLRGKTYRCGASLIHPQVAATAAHCVEDPGEYKVRAGEWNWRSAEEALPHQDRVVGQVVVHPYYHANSLSNDIALLVLETPFALAENVGVICLPPAGVTYDGTRCIASGWGKNSYEQGTYQTTLKKVDLPVVPRGRCLRKLRDARLGPFFNLHRSFLCAGGGRDKDTCKGDGGSPLICPIEGQPDRYEQVGIVSWGLTCGLFDTPGVYVNVAMFSDWIDVQMLRLNFDTSIYRY